MKILFQNRSDALTAWGGDTTQMMQTKEHLVKLGVHVDICLEAEPDLCGYDIVHVFNIQTAHYSLRQVINAKKQKVPVVVSPIYWDMRQVFKDEDYLVFNFSLYRLLTRINLSLAKFYMKFKRKLDFRSQGERLLFNSMLEMLKHADLLLPNSYAEAEIISILFNAPWVRAKFVVIPNGIALPSTNEDEKEVSDPVESQVSLPAEYVLEAGRIEPTKGQLKVIKALLDKPEIPIVFVGKCSNQVYWEECVLLGKKRGNVWFVEEVPQHTIAKYYKRARVHVLPSLRESPGLATLEAAVHGVNCVVSFHGPIAEYFDDNVWCCDPSDITSIKNAIIQAWQAPPNLLLRQRILENFTWEAAAKETVQAYCKILSKNN